MDEQQMDQQNAASKGFRCPNCTAEMRYDAGKQLMSCEHCGHEKQIAAEEGSETIVEYNLEEGLAGGAAKRGLGTKVHSTRCQECGATVSFPEAVVATECAFCGSSQVLQQEPDASLIRPESVVPFKVDQKTASAAFSTWLKGLWFRPSDLKKKAEVTDINGVYVPYWTFDAHVDSSWTAEAGYYYYETEYYTDSDGDEREREVRKTRWEQAWGDRSDFYDDVLICASKGLPDNLAERLSTFDTTELKGYDPGFLSGWKAEEYALNLNDAWKLGVGKIESGQDQRCGGDVPGDTHRFLNVTNRFSKETFKHVLLPIWISAYRYGDKVFRFLVNGQTGEVVGKAPWSWIKITLFTIVMVAIVAVIAILYNRYR